MKILSILLTVALLGVTTATIAQENKPDQRPQVSQNEQGPRGPMMGRGQFGPGPRGPMFRGGQKGPQMQCKCLCCKKQDMKFQKRHRGNRK